VRGEPARRARIQFLADRNDQNSIADAVADLGKPEEIGQLFSGFQRFLDAASA